MVETFQLNAIAKGHNNSVGLRNLEAISVNGIYLVPIRDIGTYRGGQLTRRGDGRVVEIGYPSQMMDAAFLSNAQNYWLRTSILNGNISGPVTFQMHRYGVSVSPGMLAPMITVNAMMELTQGPDTARYSDGETGFQYKLTRLVVIEEDMYYADIKVTGGVVSQDNVGATPEKLTAFDANGLYNGITPDYTDSSLEVLVTAKYTPQVDLFFTSTGTSITWTFTIYKNGVATDIIGQVTCDATPKLEGISFGGGRRLDLDADDLLTIYIHNDDGTALADITVVEGAFGLASTSSV